VYESDSQNAFAEWHAHKCVVVEAVNVSVIRLPDQMGLDDFLAAGHSEDELLALVEGQDARCPTKRPAHPRVPRGACRPAGHGTPC